MRLFRGRTGEMPAIGLNVFGIARDGMPSEKELIDERKKKVEQLRAKGVNPYPYRFEVTHTARDVQGKYASLKSEEKTKDKVRVAGRVIALRRMGKVTFMHVQDGSGKVQRYVSKEEL